MVNRILLAIIAGLVMLSGFQGWRLTVRENQLLAQAEEIQRLEINLATMVEREAVVEEFRNATEAVASQTAQICRDIIEVRVKHTIEAVEIENAPDIDSAVDAYDRLLCRRPEAAGHPRCAALATTVSD